MGKLFLLSITFAILSTQSHADRLVFAYGPGNGEPFAITKGNTLVSGLFKDMGDEIASRLGYTAEYRHTPQNRVAQLLKQGDIDGVCMTHPDWIEEADSYIWSKTIAQDFDHLVSLKERNHDFRSLSDLHSLMIGAMTGYIYSEDLMRYISSGKAQRRDFNNLDALYSSLLAERIDTIIDSKISFNYRKKTLTSNQALSISELTVYQYDLYCAFSPKWLSMKSKLLGVIDQMIHENRFSKIIKTYQ